MIRLFVVFSLLVTSESLAAAPLCSTESYSIIYINGIFTDHIKAKADRALIFEKFDGEYPGVLNENAFKLGYNATHLGGIGDVLKSILQKMWELEGKTPEDFDLAEIIRQVQPQVDTQKILILGHSQGTFYANALYDYLIRRGVSAQSISVLNLATPASYAAGHGKHLTNANDALVGKVRAVTEMTEHPEPLPANLDIPLRADDTGIFAGHSLSGVYLKERPTNIAAAIAGSLAKLESDPTRDPSQPCIPLADTNVAHVVKRAAFAVADTLGSAIGNTPSYMPVNPISPIRNLASAIMSFASLGGSSSTGEPVTTPSRQPVVLPAPAQAGSVLGISTENEITETPPDNEFIETVAATFEEPMIAAPTYVNASYTEPPPAAPDIPLPARSFGGLLPLDPGFGAAPSGSVAQVPVAQSVSAETVTDSEGEEVIVEEREPAAIISPPVSLRPSLAVLEPLKDAFYATTTIHFSGTSDAGNTVSILHDSVLVATATAAVDGSWNVVLTTEEGTQSFVVSAENTMGDDAPNISVAITVDTIAPSISTVSVPDCALSISSSACVLVQGTTTVFLSDVGDATAFRVTIHGAEHVQHENTITLNLVDEATTTVEVVGIDAAGNQSRATSTSIIRYSRPLLINEVAWAGTTAVASDEWIELLNVSPFTLDLSTFRLTAASGSFAFNLQGTLAPYSAQSASDTYLIESRTAATAVTHDQLEITLSMNDAGDQLILTQDGRTIDSTPAIATCGGWCAGAAKTAIRYSELQGAQQGARSMERVSDTAEGSLPSAWQIHDAYVLSSGAPTDASGNYVLGSVKKDTAAPLPTMGWYCGAAPFESGSSYIPEGSACTYLSGFIHTNANRYGALFRGTVGSSTEIVRHSMNKNMISPQTGDTITSPIPGEKFFVAIYEIRNGPAFGNEVQNFTSYFTGAVAAPPHTNYRVFEWVYGGASP
ncbi:MAG: hypothetical protein KBE09_04940 [Candidatus Pacebacteria bacterium]|nr:hypothetical protein [Candidatus Paceibacterota bacterium]